MTTQEARRTFTCIIGMELVARRTLTPPAVGSVDTELGTAAIVFITFIDITVSLVLGVWAVRDSVTDTGQLNTAGVSAEEIAGEITGEVRAVCLVRTIRTVRGAVTEVVSRNTVRGRTSPHVEAAECQGRAVLLVTAITAVPVSVTQPGGLRTPRPVLALELISLARLCGKFTLTKVLKTLNPPHPKKDSHSPLLWT